MLADGSDGDILVEKIICEIPHKDMQWRLTVNTFREVEYIHIRKYYLSFDEGYQPTREGACFPATLDNVARLMGALCEVLAESESLHIINKHMSDIEDIVLTDEEPH